MKKFFIGMISFVAFAGMFYVITTGQHYEHVRAGAQFETFYDMPLLQGMESQRISLKCADGIGIIFEENLKRVTVFFDQDNYAVTDFDRRVDIPSGTQYRSDEDSLTIDDDGTAFLIIEGTRVASDCK